MELKDYLKESFNKEYGYRVKFAFIVVVDRGNNDAGGMFAILNS